MWKGQNRLFGWDYVPYELEQPAAQYYEYATTKGERVGRAAWNKKPFQGFQWESVDLPGKLYFMLTLGNYEGFQKWGPTVANTNNTNGLMYTASASGKEDSRAVPMITRSVADKGTGIGDLYRQATVGRVAIGEVPLPGGQALPIATGFNFINFKLNNDYAKQFRYSYFWGGLANGNDASPLQAWGIRKNWNYVDSVLKRTGKPDTTLRMYVGVPTDTFNAANYFVSYKTFSLDFRQNVPGKVSFLVDIGMNQTDTSYFKVQDSGATSASDLRRYKGIADSATIVNTNRYEVLGHKQSSWTPAVYAQAGNLISGTLGAAIPVDLAIQSVFAPKNLYSGTSFIMPGDFFFPYEANLLGAGKFAGYDGGTPYVSNMTGANATIKYTRVPNGHLRFNVGYHTQLEKGSNLVWIPWRLNGTAFKLSLNQSTTQYDGQGLTDDYLRGDVAGSSLTPSDVAEKVPGYYRQIRRFGNEFFSYSNPNKNVRRNPYAPVPGLAGGIRNDFMSTFENFGAFKIRRDSRENFQADSGAITEMLASGDLPQATKASQNFSLDYGQDISPLWSGTKPVFLGFYGALNGVTTGGLANPSDDKTLLSGYLLRLEPVFQLHEKFWLIGLVGQERWYSRYGVSAIDSTTGYMPGTDAKLFEPRNWRSAPIDYTDWAFGGGFDWNLAPRVELHTRLQYFTHRDDGISNEIDLAKGKNDFEAWMLHAETKMWF